MTTEKIKQAINSFDEEHFIERVILIGKDGAIRQIVFEVDE